MLVRSLYLIVSRTRRHRINSLITPTDCKFSPLSPRLSLPFLPLLLEPRIGQILGSTRLTRLDHLLLLFARRSQIGTSLSNLHQSILQIIFYRMTFVSFFYHDALRLKNLSKSNKKHKRVRVCPRARFASLVLPSARPRDTSILFRSFNNENIR